MLLMNEELNKKLNIISLGTARKGFSNNTSILGNQNQNLL